MDLLISPVSGGYFPAQVAAMKIIYKTDYKPDIIGGSSGGNVANYISLLGDFSPERMDLVLKDLSSKLFVKKWFGSPMPSELYGFFVGSFFNSGDGGYYFVDKFTTSSCIKRVEIWTGTYNSTHGKARFFCNKSSDKSIIGDVDVDRDILQTLDSIYCDGDINLIVKVIMASASIPGVVPAQKINGEFYEDGGLYYASPAAYLTAAMQKSGILKHILYVNSFDIQGDEHIKSKHNVLKNAIQATNILIKNTLIQDRLICYRTLFCNDENSVETELGEFTVCSFRKYIRDRKNWKYSLLEIYPRKICEVDIINFVGQDALHKCEEATDYLSYRLWYVPKS